MPTSVHIPPALLKQVDHRAKALKLSRNRFIVESLQSQLEHQTDWSPGFFEKLSELEPGDADVVDQMLAAVLARRTRKKAQTL